MLTRTEPFDWANRGPWRVLARTGSNSDRRCLPSTLDTSMQAAPPTGSGTRSPIVKRCYARIGLLGNPSDGYGGCTISLSLANFWAEVTIAPSDTLSFVYHPVHDCGSYASLAELSDHVQRCGPGTGTDLLKMLCHVFYRHCQSRHIALNPQHPAFTLSWDTTIPRQSGLSGSSAIITAGLECLMEWYGVTSEQIPVRDQPSLILSVETALGITAGLQDRVIQVYGGLVFMDFTDCEAQGCGRYEPLDPHLLPTLWLIWGHYPSSSGKVHSSVRKRWLEGESLVHDTMKQLAQCAIAGRAALEAGDVEGLAKLMDENFRLRRVVFGDEVVGKENIGMVKVARSVGASAKLPGSGGAVVALCPQGGDQEAALLKACQAAGLHIERVLVGPPKV